MKKYYLLATMIITMGATGFAQEKPGYRISAEFPIKSSGGYDYLTVDSASDNLYISHGSQVNILNKNSGDSIGVVTTEKDVHGIALVHSLGKGYISNGSLNKVLVFDLATNQVLKYVPTGKFSDAIFY